MQYVSPQHEAAASESISLFGFPRRVPKADLIGETLVYRLDARVASRNERIIVTSTSNPPETSNLVLKVYRHNQTEQLIRELQAYRDLKEERGKLLPLCYGLHEVVNETSPEEEMVLALERVEGRTLEAIMNEGSEKDDQFMTRLYSILEHCWSGMLRLHKWNRVHGDLAPRNIIVRNDHVVFLDLENAA